VFEQPQWAPTPGQAIVFWQNDEVLGGATIESSEK
jgi:tRNA U34 2-thiouridine synthase MnmA/TrmU